MTIELFDVRDRERLRVALALRFEVFVEEQGVPADEEIDAHDREDLDAVHAVVSDENGAVVAAGRFFRSGAGIAQIGRMVVARRMRGRGTGAALLEALIAEARRRGYERARLDAQLHAVEFYAKAGFAPAGERLLDAGIVHQPMEKLIRFSSNY